MTNFRPLGVFAATGLVCLLTCHAQLPDSVPWAMATNYNHGYAQWRTEPGKLYRMERSADQQNWTLLPERYYGFGQTVTQSLHADFNPDFAAGISAATAPPRPPDVNPPTMPSSLPVHATGEPWTRPSGAAIEALLSQDSLSQVNGNYREVDLTVLIQIRNRGLQTAQNVQANVLLTTALANLLSSSPPVATLQASDPAVVLGSLTPNLSFDGSTDTRLLSGDDSLSAGANAALKLTLHFSFSSSWSLPRSPRYLYAYVSAGTSSVNPGATWNGSGVAQPPTGATTYEASADRYVWGDLIYPNPVRSTPLYFFDNTEKFQRFYLVTGFSNGGSLVSWFSPGDRQFVKHYFGPGIFDLCKPGGGYYSGLISLRRNHPAPAPGVQPYPDQPTFGCPTRIEIEVLANGSYNSGGTPTTVQTQAVAPANEYLAKELFYDQRGPLLERLAAQTAPAVPTTPSPSALNLTDHDLSTKQREFFRVRRFDIDSNFNGIDDATEMNSSDGWLWNLNDDDDLIPNGYDEYATADPEHLLTVIINEICASNKGSFKDSSGASPDWVELYNISNSTVNLSGFKLRDEGTNPANWYTFPSGSELPSG